MALLAALVAVTLLASSPAAAHAFLQEQHPGPDERLTAPPSEVRLVFSERLEPAFSHGEVHAGTANGTRVDTDGGKVPDGQPNVLVISLAPSRMGNGTYAVHWTALSVDAHGTAGEFRFTVLTDAMGEAPTQAGTGHEHGPLGRILALAGLLCVPGILLVAWRIHPSATQRRELHAYAGAMAVLATVGAAFVLLDAAEPLGTVSGYILHTQSGPLLLGAAVAMAAAAGLLVRTVSHPARWHARTAAALCGVAILCTAATSHGAARTTGVWLSATADALHIAAASVWVGGVVALALWLPRRGADEAALAVARFSPWAAAAVAVLVAAGSIGAVVELRRPSDLWQTGYGALLLGKVLLAGVLVGLGAVNRYRNGPGLVRGTVTVATLRRTVAFEVFLMLLAIIATSLLTAAVPPAQLP